MGSQKNLGFLIVMAILLFVATILGWHYSLTGDASGFSPCFWPLGFFTWDDDMILGTFLLLGTTYLIAKKDPIATGLFFSAYVMLRALIETLYNLNAQFSPITRPWEARLPAIGAQFHLQLVEVFVIAQVFYTALCVTAGLILLSYVKRYLKK